MGNYLYTPISENKNIEQQQNEIEEKETNNCINKYNRSDLTEKKILQLNSSIIDKDIDIKFPTIPSFSFQPKWMSLSNKLKITPIVNDIKDLPKIESYNSDSDSDSDLDSLEAFQEDIGYPLDYYNYSSDEEHYNYTELDKLNAEIEKLKIQLMLSRKENKVLKERFSKPIISKIIPLKLKRE